MFCVCGLALLGCSQDAPAATYAPGTAAGREQNATGCEQPQAGCACAGNQPPVACQPDGADVARPGAANVCQEGTRYCRQGRFGACEDVHSYVRPAAPSESALIDSHAAAAPCSDCEPDCFRVSDDLDPAEGALATPIADGVAYHSSGAGLTLTPRPGAIVDPPPATVPDGTLFLSVRDGLSASVTQTSAVHPAQSEVYLLLDHAESMGEETTALQDSFDNGALLDSHLSCSHGSATSGGVAGALRCMIDTPRLGLGMFRDIPFMPYASDASEIAYRHLVDSNTDLTRTKSALLALEPAAPLAGADVAGSHIPALYSVASGEGMFMGIGRESVPDAVACRSGRFGYPCFRRSNQPIVVLVTDAPLHNGPDPAYDYDPDVLHRLRGTAPGQVAIRANNDDWNSAFALTDDAAGSLSVFYGSTTRLTAQISGDTTGCSGVNDHAKDAVFSFDVDAPGALGATLPVSLSTEGSRFDTVLSVLDHPPITAESIGIDPLNELFESAYDIGDVSARLVQVNSNTAGGPGYDMNADYQGSLFGTCGANTRSPDAVFAFDVDGASGVVPLELQLEMGAAHAVLSIYQAGVGQQPRWPARASTLVASDNSDASAAHVFEIPSGTGNEYLSVLGDTTGLGADYTPSELGNCGSNAASMDVAFKIHVEGTHHLRFDTEGSFFDTVLSLHSAPPDGTPDSLITCDDDGVAETTDSAIEPMLSDGDYYLVLKGKSGDAQGQGQYALTVRDLDAVQTSELKCDVGGDASDPARLTFDATPGETYYALVKGDTPSDQGAFSLQIHDTRGDDPHALECAGPSGPGGSSQLDLDLASGHYYAVLKGHASADAGDYRLVIGGHDPIDEAFDVPSYADTVDALGNGHIRVATVLSCASGDDACDDAQAEAETLAHDTAGVVRVAANAADVPAQVIKAVQLIESFDVVRGELRFSPDANPGFVKVAVTALPDPNNGCASIDASGAFHDCVPGSTPSFALTLTNPALAPVMPSSGPFGAYRMTLRLSAERDGSSVLVQDVPVLVAPSGVAPADTYSSGDYYQDLDSHGCANVNQRASWDQLTFDADVRPDTRLTISACTADDADALDTCGDADTSASGYKRVVSVSAGSGAGTPCTAATQAEDCPNGYCSPYTGICNDLEGASCSADTDCPGGLPGSCRAGASFTALGKTCTVPDAVASPVTALGDGNNYRPFMRVRLQLESLGDGSRTPSVFFWEARYRCRNVE